MKAWLMSALLAFGVATSIEGATRVVKDAEGQTVEVPEQPSRVAALSEIDLDSCLALGLKPVGTVNGRGQKAQPHYLLESSAGEAARTVPVVGDLGRPNMEALVAAKPDLILTGPTRPEVLALLKKIAPTVVTFKNDEPWTAVFDRVAVVLNQEAKAKDVTAAYDKEVQAAKTKLAHAQGKSVSIVRWNPNGPAFMYEDSFASLVLRDMGLVRPAPQRVAGQKHSMPISLEALHMIDGDYLFLGTLEPKGDAADALKDVAANPAFQKLAAVKGKRHFAVDGSKWTSVGGPLAALSVVREATAFIGGQAPTLGP